MTLSPPPPSRTRGKTLFLTFYSFKGGVGRTMSLLNAACILAARGRRVLLIDFDLEAPGLTTLRDLNSNDSQPHQHPGLVELIHDFLRDPNASALADKTDKSRFRDEYICSLEVPAHLERIEGGCLHLMPSGRMDDTYGKRLNAIKFDQIYEAGIGQPMFKLLKNVILQSRLYDYVLIDSRTGFSDEGGICTRDLADHLFVVMGLNRQNVDGTVRFLQSLKRSGWQEGRVFFIVSPMPVFYEELRDKRLQEAQIAIELAGYKTKLDLRVPYHPRLALDEEPFVYHWSETNLFDAYQRIYRQIRSLGNDTPRAWSDEALKAVQSGQFEQALHLLKQIKIENSDSAVNLLSIITSQMAEDIPALRKNLSPFFDLWIETIGEDADVLRHYGTALMQNRDYARAEEKLNRGLQLAEEQKSRVQIANAYLSLGGLKIAQDKFAEAYILFKLALDNFEELEDKYGTAAAYGSLGNACRFVESPKEALTYYQKAQRIFIREKDYLNAGHTYYHIGSSFVFSGNYDRALKSFQQASKLYARVSDRSNLATLDVSIGDVFLLRGDVETAQRHFTNAEATFKDLDDADDIASVQHSMGDLFQIRKDFQAALEQYQTAMKHYEEVNNQHNISATLGEIGKIRVLMADANKGMQMIEQANFITERLGVLETLAEGRTDYAEALFLSKMPENALDYLNEHWKLIEEHAAAHVRAEASVLRAKIYFALGSPANAQMDLQAALKFYHSQQVHTPIAREAEELAASLTSLQTLHQLD